jgi:hypothetical protein
VHNAGLDLRLRVHRLDGFGEAAQPVDDGDQDVVKAAVLEFVKNLGGVLDSV